MGGLGGFMVQGLAAPGFAHCQSSIQALFLKFLFHLPPRWVTEIIPVEWNPNMKKHPCIEELTTTFFFFEFPLTYQPSPTLPSSHSL